MKTLKILIAEDNKLLHGLYDEGLPSGLFEKRFVDNGKDALEEYKSWKPDIIILDYMIPKINGFKVLEEIRNRVNDHSTIIIMSTFMYNHEYVDECNKLGIQGFIVKPFKIRDMLQCICDCFEDSDNEVGKRLKELLRKK